MLKKTKLLTKVFHKDTDSAFVLILSCNFKQ